MDSTSDLLSLKNEINQLKTLIVTNVEQITKAMVSFKANNCTQPSSDMDTDATTCCPDTPIAPPTPPNQLDLPVIIKELKNDIATITHEM